MKYRWRVPVLEKINELKNKLNDFLKEGESEEIREIKVKVDCLYSKLLQIQNGSHISYKLTRVWVDLVYLQGEGYSNISEMCLICEQALSFLDQNSKK